MMSDPFLPPLQRSGGDEVSGATHDPEKNHLLHVSDGSKVINVQPIRGQSGGGGAQTTRLLITYITVLLYSSARVAAWFQTVSLVVFAYVMDTLDRYHSNHRCAVGPGSLIRRPKRLSG